MHAQLHYSTNTTKRRYRNEVKRHDKRVAAQVELDNYCLVNNNATLPSQLL